MVKWNWRKSRIIFPRENEHLVYYIQVLVDLSFKNLQPMYTEGVSLGLVLLHLLREMGAQKLCGGKQSGNTSRYETDVKDRKEPKIADHRGLEAKQS